MVIYTDTLQFFVMIGGSLVLSIKGELHDLLLIILKGSDLRKSTTFSEKNYTNVPIKCPRCLIDRNSHSKLPVACEKRPIARVYL